MKHAGLISTVAGLECRAQNESLMLHPQIYKGFTREEGAGELHEEELEVSVSFSTGIFPFSNAAQQDALAG